MKEKSELTSIDTESAVDPLEPDRRALLAVRSNKIDMLRAVYENAEKLAELRTIERRRCQPGIVLTYALLLRRQRIVTYLMRVCGERLMLPHPISCNCEFCARLRVDAKAKDVYITETLKAITSPLYLYHLEDDPFIFSVTLVKILHDWRRANFFSAGGYTNSYRLIRRSIDRTLLIFLQTINTDDEANVFFTYPIASSPVSAPEKRFSDRRELSRLKKLLDMKLTKSATCQTTQSFIDKRFGEGTQWLPQNTMAQFGIAFICYFVLTPVLLLWPHPYVKRIFSSPRFAAMLETTSIVLYICIASMTVSISDLTLGATFCSKTRRPTILINGIILGFLIGRIFLEAYELSVINIKRFYQTIFDVFLTISIAFHLAAILVRLVWIGQLNAFMTSHQEIQRNLCRNMTDDVTDASICRNTLTGAQRDIITTMLQPAMISHFLTAFGHFFIIISVGNIFVWNKALGVLTITVTRMMNDVIRFFMLMSFTFLAFFIAFSVIYIRYDCANENFGNTLQTSITLFWAIFQMSSNDVYKISGIQRTYAEDLSQTYGFFLFAIWLAISNVVLVNFLIAMMVNTYQGVQENKDRTWLFTRTRRTVKYLLLRQASNEPYFPAPWNLLWPIYLVSNFIWKACATLLSRDDGSTKQDSNSMLGQRREQVLQTCLDRVQIDLRIDIKFQNHGEKLCEADVEDMLT